jgi:TorA maturation chaperone TorD
LSGPAPSEIAEEDTLRANCYSLLARLLRRPPDAVTLQEVGRLEGDDGEFGRAVGALAAAARSTAPETVEDEYFNLFIGITQGELTPYASYYLTGFLNEKPLARLREDMDRLGIARAENVSEPEDHIAALMEMMAGLITGAFGVPADLALQQRFFEQHIATWAPRFFEDLQAAQTSNFYMPVGSIGRLFMEVETQAFAMAA